MAQHLQSDSLSDSTFTDPSPTPASSENDLTFTDVDHEQRRAKEVIKRILGGEGEAMVAPVDKSRPLHLLDLPLDILSLIVKEITHTNDLCAVALSHSVLHSLAIPHIYSRFDIVWPDATTNVEPRSGVDALTYGLATLVMHEDVFGEAPFQRQRQKLAETPSKCAKCGHCNSTTAASMNQPTQLPPLGKRRRGNNYASFTRKFSLGNGPADWVQEYRVTTDSGKMLGSLVALAIARMRNLETFIWDMPTGILRDVWIALASLGEHNDAHGCRLEKVWVRWHSNAMVEGNIAPPSSPHHEANTFPQPVSAGTGANSSNDATVARHSILNKVERPTFSYLPPLRSLNVLDIDELAYLDEMSVLISRSRYTLRELRIGIAKEASGCDWTGAWEGGGLQQLPSKKSNPLVGTNHFEKRLGGILGVLVGHVYNVRQKQNKTSDSQAPQANAQEKTEQRRQSASRTEQGSGDSMAELESGGASHDPNPPGMTEDDVPKSTAEPVKPVAPRFVENLPPPDTLPSNTRSTIHATTSDTQPTRGVPESKEKDREGQRANVQNEQLIIATLELERVPLSVPVLCGALNWSKLTELTILDCPNHEQLWRVLRRRFSPKPSPQLFSDHPSSTPGRRMSKALTSEPLEYELKLRKVHTNTVTTSLISFLRETLAPNSLETLFLQQSRHYTSKVSIDVIFRGPLRRHRASLKQLSIDSRHRDREDGAAAVGYRKWAFDRELLSFITSGRMPRLRELGMSIDGKDWVSSNPLWSGAIANLILALFLATIASDSPSALLVYPFVSKDNTHVADKEARELALQIIDITTLRPEIELCYLAIAGKCFEVLEARPTDREGRGSDSSSGAGAESAESDEDEDDVDVDDADEADGDGDDGDAGGADNAEDGEETETEEEDAESSGDGDSDSGVDIVKSQFKLKLREILFYDDKIAIFKARHGRL